MEVVAFMECPVVIAGLCDEDRVLYGDKSHPEKNLVPDNEQEWSSWITSYRTCGQDRNLRFIPLYEIGYEKFSVYYRIQNKCS